MSGETTPLLSQTEEIESFVAISVSATVTKETGYQSFIGSIWLKESFTNA